MAVLGQHLLEPALRVMQHNSLNLMGESAQIEVVEHDPFKECIGIAVEAFDALFNGSDNRASQYGSTSKAADGLEPHSFLNKLLRDIVSE